MPAWDSTTISSLDPLSLKQSAAVGFGFWWWLLTGRFLGIGDSRCAVSRDLGCDFLQSSPDLTAPGPRTTRR